jgi:hypothetical protein
MFRSTTIIRELALNLAKVIFMLKHSVKLRRYMLFGDVAACCHISNPQHGSRETTVLRCGLEKNGMVGAWHGHGMASVNQTRLHCVNQMGKTHSTLLAARHGRGTAYYV